VAAARDPAQPGSDRRPDQVSVVISTCPGRSATVACLVAGVQSREE